MRLDPTVIPVDMDDQGWASRCAYWSEQSNAKPKGNQRAEREPLILTGHGVRLRVERGTLLVRNGFTHYPQRREEWRLFPGDWRLPSRIVILDGDGSMSLDVLAWLSARD